MGDEPGHHGAVTQAMWESDRRAHRRPARWWGPLLIGCVIAIAQIKLVSAAWDSCDLSGSTGISTTSLYALGVPALTFLNWLLVALPAEVYLPKHTTLVNRWVLTIVTTIVLVAAETVVIGYYIATPDEPVGGTCTDNVPDWWPDRLPA